MPFPPRSPGLLAHVLLALPAFAAPPEEPLVLWQGETRTLDELERSAGAAAADAARAWAPFAQGRDYRLHLADGREALLVLPGRGRSGHELLKLIAATAEHLGPLLPAAIPQTPADGGPGPFADGELPPALEEEELVAPPAPQRTPVLVQLRDTKDYGAALDHLAERHPYLREWAERARRDVYGFVLLEPLVGAWLEDAPGNEEWDPRNELVNRFAQLAVLARAGRQPYWLQLGLAWNAEQAVRGTIYCFPYRSGFVGVGEHGGWAPVLKRLLKGKDARPTMAQIDALRRGAYDDTAAAWAWGAARFLMLERPEELPRVLADLDLLRRREGIVDHGDGTWTLQVDYEIPAERQLEILARHCGEDVLAELGDWLRGLDDRPKRKAARAR